MEIITFAATKGGVGKTTLTYNFGEWLADKGYNVLLVDNDHQSSLSQTYDIYSREHTIVDIYKNNGENARILNVRENLDILPSTLELEEVNEQLQSKAQKELILFMWFSENINDLRKYDYVLIDNHPDFSTVTKNAIAISDYIISPLEPGEYSYISKSSIEVRLDRFKQELRDPRSRESYVQSKLLFVANNIRHNTNSSRELSEIAKNDESIVAIIPEKELFNTSTKDHYPIVKMKEDKTLYSKHKKFFDTIDNVFESLRLQIDAREEE